MTSDFTLEKHSHWKNNKFFVALHKPHKFYHQIVRSLSFSFLILPIYLVT